MALDVTAILSGLTSHAKSLGLFEQVNTHEPKNAPGSGLRLAIWCDGIAPAEGRSGLDATSIVLTFNARIMTNMVQEPQDLIDPALLHAVDVLMTTYTGDFDLFGTVAEVDLLGQFGDGLSATAGYINYDQKLYRCMTLVIPLVVNDLWNQES